MHTINKITPTDLHFKVLILFILCFSFAAHAAKSINVHNLKNGDLIFHSSTSNQALAIQLATNSIYNHMGIIFFKKSKPYVLEAIGRVTYTPLKVWINRGIVSSYKVMRLKNSKKILTISNLKRLRLASEKMLGKRYDAAFHWSDKKMYCSELVWKAYQRALNIRIGELKTLKSFNLSNPIVLYKIRQRYGKNIPYDSLVITPADMIRSKLLQPVKIQ